MNNVNIKEYICTQLPFEEQCVALNFVSFLETNGITFHKDNSDCWKNKIYYWCKYNDDCVCFISIKYDADNEIKKLVWKYVDHCDHCGSCRGGQHKIIFGREFRDVCGCTFRVDNPTIEDLPFLKEMIKLCITNVGKGTK